MVAPSRTFARMEDRGPANAQAAGAERRERGCAQIREQVQPEISVALGRTIKTRAFRDSMSYLSQIAEALGSTIGEPPASKLGAMPSPAPAPPPQPVQSPVPDIWAEARQQYPVLNNPNLNYLYTPRSGPNVPYLETFPPGEGGGKENRVLRSSR